MAKADEQQLLDTLLAVYPSFVEAGLNWVPGPSNEAPDFIATPFKERRIGLELTEWLHPGQTSISISNQETRVQILEALDCERRNCPAPLTRVLICDRLNVAFNPIDLEQYVTEVYRFVEEAVSRWPQVQFLGIWNASDLAYYPMLAKYVQCVTFYGPPRFSSDPSGVIWNAPGMRWINFEPVGGIYDPQWAVNGLLSRILDKTHKYHGIKDKIRLHSFALLIHYGIRGMIHNTPYSGKSATLADASKQAHELLLQDHGEFDAVYLYMNFNGGHLIELFPTLQTLRSFSVRHIASS